jgi:uncharacterized protein (TIGR03503 family)
MMKGVARLALLFTMAAFVSWGQTLAAAGPVAEKADVRILIDVSGSMKKNDPKNLRRPALRLLVGLLSSETRAGVWTFGQYVNMQIPLGQVDKAWKRKARHSSKSIGSPGQFTNIEDALKRSTEDWSGPPGPYRRSVILLTDGMVDISKNKAKNAASKQRILKKVLPRLKQHQVTVHTIALSKNADHELMQELAGQTGGWYEQTETADELQKVFLRIFEKVGKPDSVPLKDNKFSIDPSITEATLLVFHKPGAKPTEVVPPGGQMFNADSAPASVSWHRDEGYDMLTITDPKAGEWRIRAEADPDNRVMVVTDLKMLTTDLPNQLIHGLSIPYQVSFTDHGKTINKLEFLRMVNVSATRMDSLGRSEPRPMSDDGREGDKQADDGFFTMIFGGESVQSGMGELVINAKGRTFVRERRITYQVVPPVEMNLSPRDGGQFLDLQLIADEKLIDPNSLQLEAWLEDQNGVQNPLPLQSTAGLGTFTSEIDLMSFSGPRKITLKAAARSLQGESIDYYDNPVEVEGMKPATPEPEPEPEPTPIPEPEPEPQVEVEPEIEQIEEADEEGDWISATIWFGVINLVLIILAGGIFWWRRRANRGNQINLVDEESETPDAEQENQA